MNKTEIFWERRTENNSFAYQPSENWWSSLQGPEKTWQGGVGWEIPLKHCIGVKKSDFKIAAKKFFDTGQAVSESRTVSVSRYKLLKNKKTEVF